jgi:hypothetical protein
MEEVNLANRALLLNEGSLIFDGAPEILFSDSSLLETGGLELPANIVFTKLSLIGSPILRQKN